MAEVQQHGLLGENEVLLRIYQEAIIKLAISQFLNTQHDDFPELEAIFFNIGDDIIIDNYIFQTSKILIGLKNNKIVFSDFIVLPKSKNGYSTQGGSFQLDELYSLIGRTLTIENKLNYSDESDVYDYFNSLYSISNREYSNELYFPRTSVKLSKTNSIDNAAAQSFIFDYRELNFVVVLYKQKGKIKSITKSKVIFINEEELSNIKGDISLSDIETLQSELLNVYLDNVKIINGKNNYKLSAMKSREFRKNNSTYDELRAISPYCKLASKISGSEYQNRMQNVLYFSKILTLLDIDPDFSNELLISDITSSKRK